VVNKIYSIVEQLVKKHHTRNPFELASLSGIVVMLRDLAELKGFYTVENKTRYIVINERLDDYLRCLICCHELGHDCLHRQFAQYDSLRDYTMFDCTGKTELEANLFAADLMIPDTDIILKIRWESNTYEQIAKMLYVPEALVKFKVYSISKRGYGIHTPELAKADFLKDI